MPEGLDIDRKHDLNGSMATYTRHVVIFTGQNDWGKKIEEDGENTAWGDVTRKLKGMTTRGGVFADVSDRLSALPVQPLPTSFKRGY